MQTGLLSVSEPRGATLRRDAPHALRSSIAGLRPGDFNKKVGFRPLEHLANASIARQGLKSNSEQPEGHFYTAAHPDGRPVSHGRFEFPGSHGIEGFFVKSKARRLDNLRVRNITRCVDNND